jgi:hypothetical protein
MRCLHEPAKNPTTLGSRNPMGGGVSRQHCAQLRLWFRSDERCLGFTKEKTLLLTGLTNAQVIRTAEVIDLSGIIFVRGKRPPQEVIAMAKERNLPLLMTELPLYETCGVLYSAGLEGCSGLPSRRR